MIKTPEGHNDTTERFMRTRGWDYDLDDDAIDDLIRHTMIISDVFLAVAVVSALIVAVKIW